MRARCSLLFTFAIVLLVLALLSLLRLGSADMAGVPVAQSSAAEPTMEVTTLPVPSPETTLARLKEAKSITIEDTWGGLGIPHKAYYQLEQQNDRFVGKGSFLAGWTPPTPVIVDISIPGEIAKDFLETLADSPAVYGVYEPRVEHTDDYPSLKIELTLPDQTVRFYSLSQGEDHVPWGLDIQGNTYVIDSDEPAKALALLKPYLKWNILREVIDKQYLGMPETGKQDSQP